MPKTLSGHSSLTLRNELIVFGGESTTGGNHYSTSVYKMSCNNGIFFEWTEMAVQLKIPRTNFVASFIPNDLVDSQSVP